MATPVLQEKKTLEFFFDTLHYIHLNIPLTKKKIIYYANIRFTPDSNSTDVLLK